MAGSFTVRAEEPADTEGLREASRQAFGRELEVEFVDAVRASEQFIPEMSLVAVVDGRVIGHAMLSRITIATSEGAIPALSLAPVAVVPEWQRRGVGSAMVRAGLDRARERGERIVVVEGHPGYYPRFGFAPGRAQGLEYPYPVPDAAFMAQDLASGRIQGVTGKVIYPPAFDLVE